MAKVAIDPGHGGKDPGAVDGTANDPISTVEKTIALNVSLVDNAHLVRSAVQTLMTRTGDSYPTLAQRSDMANAWEADCFVSIHCNAHYDGSPAHGIEILHHPNSVRGKALGNAIMPFVSAVSPWIDRTVRPDTRGLHVLGATTMPAVIVEIGYLTHTAEEALLATAEYQERIGIAIAQGTCAWLGVPYVGEPVTPIVPVPIPEPVPDPGSVSERIWRATIDKQFADEIVVTLKRSF